MRVGRVEQVIVIEDTLNSRTNYVKCWEQNKSVSGLVCWLFSKFLVKKDSGDLEKN